MATQEKLLKSLEFLKTRSSADNPKKKERIQHCHVVTEAISNSTIKVAPSFHSYLSITIEVLLQLCDDDESDVRMTAEECLNRIIRALSDSNIGKVQIELHKGIKRNGSARSLRAALLRFSQLAHLIRPHKGKPYVANLIPALIKISTRTEEQIHETLANSLQPIMKVLGSFTSDNEIKSLLKAFLKNITNESAAIRRSATNATLSVCLNCRKPNVFLIYVTNYLLDMIIPLTDILNDCQTLGVLLGLKALLPHLKDQTLDRLLQIYELSLYCLSNKDHNIVNASLETLNFLLQNCPPSLKEAILSPNGIDKSRLFTPVTNSLLRVRSPSQLSVNTNTTEDVTESELTDTLRVDIEKWIGESQLSIMNMNCAKALDKSLSQDSKSTSVDFSLSEFDSVDYSANEFTDAKRHSSNDNLESDNSSDKSSFCVSSSSIHDLAQEVCIGSYLEQDISLHYCTRLIVRNFLLTGQCGGCISDKSIRVSMKSLALTCFSTILKLEPHIMSLYLDKNYNSATKNNLTNQQQLTDVILYENHQDPQLRGMVRVVIANFIRAVLDANQGDYADWQRKYLPNCNEFHLEFLIDLMVKGLKDESSNCSRQALISLNNCLNDLMLQTVNANCVGEILKLLPTLVLNPYWLIKVSLCELVAKLNYANIYFVTGTSRFQNHVVSVLFVLIQDDDCRVRHAAAIALAELIPFLYYDQFALHENVVLHKSIIFKEKYLSNLCDDLSDSDVTTWKYLLESVPFPFSQIGQAKNERIEYALAKILSRLYCTLLTSTERNSILGCYESLSLLAKMYPTTIYSKGWNCSIQEENTASVSMDLLNKIVHFLDDSILVYDLTCHLHLLNLTSNLIAGYALNFLRIGHAKDQATRNWQMFDNDKFAELVENYLGHVLKLLNIFHFVLDEVNPHHLQSKPVLPNLGAASPLKRRKSDLEKKTISPIKLTEKDDKDKKDVGKVQASSFLSLPHYLKIYDGLKSSYTNYKTSLQTETSEKLLSLLRETLSAFSVLMEIGGLSEFQGIADEILGYFYNTFQLEASGSVECVQQLLKCLFGTNLTANINDIRKKFEPKPKIVTDTNLFGFYYNIYQKTYDDVSLYFSLVKNLNSASCDDDSTVMGYLHRKEMKSLIAARSNDEILANYIRIFEPMVIKSLKLYTITSDVKLQCQVLQLLNQLIQLRVNYCLLDSEQIFIGFVLKQFEFIEEGQIPHADELIKRIFQFLVQLSHSKQHSKTIISIPKIIQLCDGLLASGQSSLTHCIPALKPIVENIFLSRSKIGSVDLKELETTREVVLSTLLKLSKHYQVIELLILILNDSKYCSSNPEKWLRWSGQVFNVISTLFSQNKIEMNDIQALVALRTLIFVLEPSIFKPIDSILLLLFQECGGNDYKLWLGRIIFCLLLVSAVKEDNLLVKITELKSQFAPGCVLDEFKRVSDPLNVLNGSDPLETLSAEMIFIKFLFKTHYLISKQILNVKDDVLIEELCIFLMYSIHIFQSGSHCKMTLCAIARIKEMQIEAINKNYLEISHQYPILTFLWCYFLTALNYKDEEFWKQITNRSEMNVNRKIVSTGGIIAFCNYMCEDLLEPGQISWFLSKCSPMLVELSDEAPVFECIASIHRDASTSKMFLDHVEKIDQKNDSVSLLRLLKCIEKTHTTYTGKLLKMLLPKFLTSKELTVCRNVAKLASRKVELLLTMSIEEVHEQLAKEDLLTMIKTMISLNLVKKYEALSSLLNKLCFQYYDISPLMFDQKRTVNADNIKQMVINKQWYLQQIKDKCNEIHLGSDTMQLLVKLNDEEIRNFIECYKRTNKSNTVRFGVVKRRRIVKNEELLIKVVISSVLERVKSICAKVEDSDLVCDSFKFEQICKLFHDFVFRESISEIIPSINSFLESLPLLSEIDVSVSNCEDLVKFGVISLELLNYSIANSHNEKVSTKFIDSVVTCTNLIFCEKFSNNILSCDEHISWLFSSVNSLYNLIEYLLRDTEPLPNFQSENTQSAGQIATHKIYILVTWLYNIQIGKSGQNISHYLFRPLRGIIVSFSRLPLVNSYVSIPLKVWKTGWKPELSGKYQTVVAPLPIELLQEIDILEEFIFRLTLLGWTNRQQFEETWMCLLSVLCSSAPEENGDDDVANAASLAVKAITALLLQTFYFPTPGHRDVSTLIHIPRNPLSNYRKLTSLTKLKHIQDMIEQKHGEFSHLPKLLNVFTCPNFEKRSEEYSYNQVSVKYLLIATKSLNVEQNHCEAWRIWSEREKVLETSGLDINSCLQFLLDFYRQLLKSPIKSLRLYHESIRSIIMISDLFTDKSQFNWMLEIFLEIAKVHIVEDELLHQYLIIGLSKAVAVLTPDLEIYDYIKKIFVQYLKSSYMQTRIACLHGLLYVLEGAKLSNITIGGISEEMQIILPCAVEYIQCNLNSNNNILRKSQEHTMLVWSLAFYLMENIDEIHMEANFISNTLQTAFNLLLIEQQKPTITLRTALMKGFERLLIVKNKAIIKRHGKQIINLALDNLRNDNPFISILGLQLLLTFMYTDCEEHVEKNRAINEPTNPDHLVQTIEKVSAIFDHIKRGYVFEVEILCHVLPDILNDFFSPADILTKVIGEFLSPQQPHPKLLSGVVFKLFEKAIEQQQLTLLQDWVVFSLSNITQSLSLGMATWCLTCFFISASSNEWLRLFFPYVQTRVGRCEFEDRKMLCIAGTDFYNGLTNDKQKQTFIENFNKIKNQPSDTLFYDLLSCL